MIKTTPTIKTTPRMKTAAKMKTTLKVKKRRGHRVGVTLPHHIPASGLIQRENNNGKSVLC